MNKKPSVFTYVTNIWMFTIERTTLTSHDTVCKNPILWNVRSAEVHLYDQFYMQQYRKYKHRVSQPVRFTRFSFC